MTMHRPGRAQALRRTAASLLLLVGLGRGLGGVLLLMQGASLDPAIRASPGLARCIGLLLVVVSVAQLGAGAMLVLGHRRARTIAAVAVSAFFLDGLLNGTVLYGRPGAGGTSTNFLVALVVLALLAFGSDPARPAAPSSAPSSEG